MVKILTYVDATGAGSKIVVRVEYPLGEEETFLGASCNGARTLSLLGVVMCLCGETIYGFLKTGLTNREDLKIF